MERIDGVTLMSPRPSLNHMKIEFYLANKLGTYLKDSVCNVLNETSLYLTNKVIDTRNNDELLDFLRNILEKKYALFYWCNFRTLEWYI